jgi:hypothetical protein
VPVARTGFEGGKTFHLAVKRKNSAPAGNRTAGVTLLGGIPALRPQINISCFSDVRFVYLASEINHYRFKELSLIDSSYPDVAIASPDSHVETVVGKIVSRIAEGKFI